MHDRLADEFMPFPRKRYMSVCGPSGVLADNRSKSVTDTVPEGLTDIDLPATDLKLQRTSPYSVIWNLRTR